MNRHLSEERVEELLRARPPDEPERAPFVLSSGIRTEVVSPARGPIARPYRRAPWLVLALVVVSVLVLVPRLHEIAAPSSSLSAGSPSPDPSAAAGVIPWIDTPYAAPTPQPTPTASDLPLCAAPDVAMLASGWGGATGSAAGRVQLVNVSARGCRLEGLTQVALLDAAGRTLATGGPTVKGYPPSANEVAVPGGAFAGGNVVWDNWCGSAPTLPLTLRIVLPLQGDAGPVATTLTAVVRNRAGVGSLTPRCDVPAGGSHVGILPLTSEAPGTNGYTPSACAASDLAAFGSRWGAAGGSSYSRAVLLNTSGFDCVLPHPLTIELRDHRGTVLLSRAMSTDDLPDAVLPAGASAIAELAFADWCTGLPATPLALDLVVGAANVGVKPAQADPDWIPVPSCNSQPATPAPFFDVGAFASPFARQPAVEQDPADSLPFNVAVSLPRSVEPGAELIYSVTLTYLPTDGKALNLATTCPSYTETLIDAKATDTASRLELNCVPAGVIAANDSRTFEMRLRVPSDAPLGTATLIWQLGERGAAVKTTLEIGKASPAPSTASTPSAPSLTKVLLAFKGSGTKSSEAFTASGDRVTLTYTFDCSGVGSSRAFALTLHDRNGIAITSTGNYTARSGGDTGPEYISNTAAPYYVDVHSTCAWMITVTGTP